MTRLRVGLGCAIALLLGVATASAQGTVKIGLINVLSGQFADAGIQLDNGVKTYMKQHGDTVAGKKIEIIRRDVGGPAPDVAKRFAQELVVRDGVDILAGFLLTPNALAAADVSAQAKKFMVVMNAATSVIITKSKMLPFLPEEKSNQAIFWSLTKNEGVFSLLEGESPFHSRPAFLSRTRRPTTSETGSRARNSSRN